jgi:hypothetical protein
MFGTNVTGAVISVEPLVPTKNFTEVWVKPVPAAEDSVKVSEPLPVFVSVCE